MRTMTGHIGIYPAICPCINDFLFSSLDYFREDTVFPFQKEINKDVLLDAISEKCQICVKRQEVQARKFVFCIGLAYL